jgi:serine/threonine-protein kinase RsbT
MASFADICAVLGRHYSAASARTIGRMAVRRVGAHEHAVGQLRDMRPLLRELKRGMDLFSTSPSARRLCISQLEELLTGGGSVTPQLPAHFQVKIIDESHIVEARTRARAMAQELGFSRTEQVKVATIVSELARNIYHYAGTGVIAVQRLEEPQRGISIEASDEGPGIADVESILAGSYRSRTGLGLGLIGCRNLTDELTIDTAPGKGTRIKARMYR